METETAFHKRKQLMKMQCSPTKMYCDMILEKFIFSKILMINIIYLNFFAIYQQIDIHTFLFFILKINNEYKYIVNK